MGLKAPEDAGELARGEGLCTQESAGQMSGVILLLGFIEAQAAEFGGWRGESRDSPSSLRFSAEGDP